MPPWLSGELRYQATRDANDCHGAAAALHNVKEVVQERLLAVQGKLIKLV